MGIKFEGKTYSGKMPAFWRGEAKILPGGYKLLQTFPKGTLFQTGDVVMKEGETTGVNVSSIDTSNEDYDVLTLSAAITELAAGDTLIEATGIADAEAKYVPNMVVGEDTEPLAGGDQDTVSAAYDAVVLLGYVPDIPASWKQGICLKNNPNIIYVKQ